MNALTRSPSLHFGGTLRLGNLIIGPAALLVVASTVVVFIRQRNIRDLVANLRPRVRASRNREYPTEAVVGPSRHDKPREEVYTSAN